MACRDDNELLSLYVDNLLTEDEAALIKAHLQTCKDCTQKITLYRLIPSVIDAPRHVAPPPDFTKVVMQRIALAQLNITSFSYDSTTTMNGYRTQVQMTGISVETSAENDDDDELDGSDTYRSEPLAGKTAHTEQRGINFSKIFGLTPGESLLNGSAPVYGKASTNPPSKVVPITPQVARRAALTYALRFSGVAAALVFMVGIVGVVAGINGNDGGDQTASSRNIFLVTRLAAIAFSSPVLALGAIGIIAAVLGCIALYINRSNRRLTS